MTHNTLKLTRLFDMSVTLLALHALSSNYSAYTGSNFESEMISSHFFFIFYTSGLKLFLILFFDKTRNKQECTLKKKTVCENHFLLIN